MKRSLSVVAIALACAVGGVLSSSAATLSGSMYEPFDYPAGAAMLSTNNLNNGARWNATGSPGPNVATANWGNAAALPAPAGAAGTKIVNSPTLNFAATGYPAGKGGTATMDATVGGGAGSTANISRSIGGQLIDAGTMYFSFLMRRNNDTMRTTSFAFFGPGGTNERFTIGQIGTGTATNAMTNGNIGLFFNNTQPTGVVNAANPIAMGAGVTHLIIGRVDWNAAGNETVTVWVDPTDVRTEPATSYIQTSGFELTSVNSIRLFSGNQAAAVGAPHNHPIKPPVSTDFDEIRLGSTWASVIPEPNSLSLAAVGLLAIARRRRAGK